MANKTKKTAVAVAVENTAKRESYTTFEVQAVALKETSEALKIAREAIDDFGKVYASMDERLRSLVLKGVKPLFEGSGVEEGSAFVMSAVLNSQTYAMRRNKGRIRSFAKRCGVRFKDVVHSNGEIETVITGFSKVKRLENATWAEYQSAVIDALPFDEESTKDAKAIVEENAKKRVEKADAWKTDPVLETQKILANQAYQIETLSPEMATLLRDIVRNFAMIQQTVATARTGEGFITKDPFDMRYHKK